MNRQLSIWQEEKNPMVRMHNYLITAKLGYLELSALRIFLLMIAKLKWDDKDLLPVKININDILPSYNGGDHIDLIIKACRELKSKMTDVEILSMENGTQVYERMSVIDKVRYVQGTDYIEAHFGRAIKPYLIDLRQNFTTTELKELMKLKSTHAIRLYLLVKSIYRADDIYQVKVKDLRAMLIGETDKYSEYKFFKRDILKATQTILKDTSASFDFMEIKKGRSVETLHLKPTNLITPSAKEFDLSESTLALLEKYSVNMFRINEMLLAGEITEDYILYVIDVKLKDKKVKKPGGAIYDSVVNKQLWADYQSCLTKAALPGKKINIASQKGLPSTATQVSLAYTTISYEQAETMYRQQKEAGKTRFPLAGFIKGLKTSKNIVVEGYSY